MEKILKAISTTKTAIKYARASLELQGWFVTSTTPEQRRVLDRIRRLRRDVRLGMDNFEAYQVYITAKNTMKLGGAMAEVGVFEGGSAQLISEVRGHRNLYLFDTFEGLPAVQDIDKEHFHAGQFRSDYEKVSDLFSHAKEVVVSKGLFPKETGHVVADERFSFVHLDVDLYQATLESLGFFYPRMIKGGVILSHDYGTAAGVRKAYDEFFSDKPEIILEPSRSQALVVKQ